MDRMQKVGTTRTLSTVKDAGGQMTSRVRRTILPGGLRVVTEQMVGARSATIGVWVDVGSRDETASLHGASHFLEHLLFKGTHERSALDISVALDAVGGEFNAFTGKEYTCFHARVLDEDLPLAVDVLGDMVTSSVITAEDVEAEREVILDEIAMHDDDPDDVVHNLFAEQAWGATSPLGRSIAGTEDSITALDRPADRALLPQALPPRAHRRLGRRQPRPRHRRAPGAQGVRPPRLPHRRPRAGPARAAGRVGCGCAPVTSRPRAPSSRSTSSSAWRASPATTSGASRSASSTPPSGEGRRAGCSRRSASAGAWPTRSTPSPRTTPTPASSASLSAACPPSSTRCSPRCAPSCHVWPPTASPTKSWCGARASCGAAWCSGLEDSASRMIRLGKAELVHDELLEIDEVMARIDAVTLDEVRDRRGRGVLAARDPRRRRPHALIPRRGARRRRGPTRSGRTAAGWRSSAGSTR